MQSGRQSREFWRHRLRDQRISENRDRRAVQRQSPRGCSRRETRRTTMTERALGDSGLPVRPFVLGGNVFEWTGDGAARFPILDRFVGLGVGVIDNADVDSAWSSEEHTTDLHSLM